MQEVEQGCDTCHRSDREARTLEPWGRAERGRGRDERLRDNEAERARSRLERENGSRDRRVRPNSTQQWRASTTTATRDWLGVGDRNARADPVRGPRLLLCGTHSVSCTRRVGQPCNAHAAITHFRRVRVSQSQPGHCRVADSVDTLCSPYQTSHRVVCSCCSTRPHDTRDVERQRLTILSVPPTGAWSSHARQPDIQGIVLSLLSVSRLLIPPHTRPPTAGYPCTRCQSLSSPPFALSYPSDAPRMCKGVAVMRRRSDSWLNATQILKVAGFDKPQRTRILEREVQKGEHEKVQGGYGKYQGESVRIFHTTPPMTFIHRHMDPPRPRSRPGKAVQQRCSPTTHHRIPASCKESPTCA